MLLFCSSPTSTKFDEDMHVASQKLQQLTVDSTNDSDNSAELHA